MLLFAPTLKEINAYEPVDPLSGTGPCVVYGAGGYGRDVAKALQRRGHTVLGFLDRKTNAAVDGLPCRPIDSDLSDWQSQNVVVVVGLHNHYVNPVPVRDQLRALGFARVYVPVEYHQSLEPQLGSRYWLGTQDIYRENLSQLETVFNLLADEKSRQFFISTLHYRALRRATAHPACEPDGYFPLDLPPWADALAWVDGGAFDGDSLLSIPLERYAVKEAYSFEPDLANFAKLQHSIAKFKKASPLTRVMSWPCGLGNQNEILTFNSGLGTASTVNSAGTTHCPIVRLDDVLQNSPVNLIKLDIEGAEPDALLGAHQIIQDQKPGLAVCIYHTPDHLWTIPLTLAEKYPGYRYYLRSHGQNGFDLVLYAIPV